MEFGLNVALRGPLATPAFITRFSREAESLGFDLMAVPDHLVVPRRIASVYPYSATGAFPGQDSGDTLEQLTTMTWIAAATTRLRVLSSVMVVPHRRPYIPYSAAHSFSARLEDMLSLVSGLSLF